MIKKSAIGLYGVSTKPPLASVQVTFVRIKEKQHLVATSVSSKILQKELFITDLTIASSDVYWYLKKEYVMIRSSACEFISIYFNLYGYITINAK